MQATTIGRIVGGAIPRIRTDALRGLRELATRASGRDLRSRRFVRYVIRDLHRYVANTPVPVEGETIGRASLAARWLARAQDATSDGGFSHGYFPLEAGGWRDSYPETTGYTIPTLFAYAAAAGEPEFRERAGRMARFLVCCQLPSGAVYGGVVGSAEPRVPVVFNTGMALLGFLAARHHMGEPAFARCIRKAADFLAGDIDGHGYFRSHGPRVHEGDIKTYTCLCAWPLYLAGREFAEDSYCRAALRVGDAALRQQRDNGWFEHNCLGRRVDAPLLHTIAYTLQGLLELGIASGERRFVDGAQRGVNGLLGHCASGFLHGRWFADWQPASFWSCLTGSAQVALVCYRLAAHTGELRYRRAADAVLNYLKALQPTPSADVDPDIVGGIGGSFPLIGSYMPNGFPGWATKFYLDALLQQLQGDSRQSSRVAVLCDADQERASRV
jgi:hypothetical protein